MRNRPALFQNKLKLLPPYQPSGRVVINPQMLIMARHSAGVTVEQVAEHTGISAARIRAMEKGKIDPTKEDVTKFSEAFYYPEHFFYQEGKIEPVSCPTFRKLLKEEQSKASTQHET